MLTGFLHKGFINKTDLAAAGVIALLAGLSACFLPIVVALLIISALLIFLSFILFSNKSAGLDVFSPWALFPALWIGCVAIGSRIISEQQTPWNHTQWIAAALALFGWLFGCIFALIIVFEDTRKSVGRIFTPPFKSSLQYIWNEKNLKFLTAVWFVAAAICTAYEFKFVMGGIPVFSANWEEDRFISNAGYLSRLIHIISYSLIPLTMVLQAHLCSQKKIFALKNTYYISLLCASLFICALWGSRHTLFIPLSAGGVLFHYLYFRFKIRHFVLLGILGLIFVGGIGYLRTSTVWEDQNIDYTEVLQDLGYEGRFPIFDQAHNTIAINFETFRWLTDTVPSTQDFQYGKFTFFPFYSLLPGKQDTLGEWQNKVWNTGFYANLTSTFMGPLYVDFGLTGIFIFAFLFAFFLTILYDSMFKSPSMLNILLFAFFVNHTIMMPYDNTIVKLHFFFNFAFLWFTNLYCAGRAENSNIEKESAENSNTPDSLTARTRLADDKGI